MHGRLGRGMALRLASRGEPTDSTPAASALCQHRAKIAEVQAEDAEWARRETDEVRYIQSATEAEQALTALEQRHVSAIADQEVLGSSTDDPTAIARQVASVRASTASVHERARLAVAKLERIRAQRAAVRAVLTTLNNEVRALQHAACSERLAAAMAVLLAAERAYVDALTTAYGIAAAVDELARSPGARLDFAGSMDVGELLLPRPHHPAYIDRPSPLRADIAAAIATEAERVAKEL
jgi:hypothetical protein